MTVIDGVYEDRHIIVMVSVIERMAYLSSFLLSMTVMTLMTVLCGSLLSAGIALPVAQRLAECRGRRGSFTRGWADGVGPRAGRGGVGTDGGIRIRKETIVSAK
jgi:hypothetical protein